MKNWIYNAYQIWKIDKKLAAMKVDRLNAPLLLFVHKDISLDFDAVIDDYAQRNPLHWRDLSSFNLVRRKALGTRLVIFVSRPCE